MGPPQDWSTFWQAVGALSGVGLLVVAVATLRRMPRTVSPRPGRPRPGTLKRRAIIGVIPLSAAVAIFMAVNLWDGNSTTNPGQETNCPTKQEAAEMLLGDPDHRLNDKNIQCGFQVIEAGLPVTLADGECVDYTGMLEGPHESRGGTTFNRALMKGDGKATSPVTVRWKNDCPKAP